MVTVADDCPMCRAMRNFLNRRVVDPVVDMGRELEDLARTDLLAGISPADLALMAIPGGAAAAKGSRAGLAVAREGRKVKQGVSAGAKLARRRLSKALREVNAKARKKSGGLKKGWSQKRIMQTAQRMARRMK